ncbi:hypothetical protein TSMEX_009011 [Taenia solium]|eukprot:TsM_000169800 transcript=TsM_000169800 gene=TsM_000169800
MPVFGGRVLRWRRASCDSYCVRENMSASSSQTSKFPSVIGQPASRPLALHLIVCYRMVLLATGGSEVDEM